MNVSWKPFCFTIQDDESASAQPQGMTFASGHAALIPA